MLTKQGNDIRTTDSRHKYDSALCEYIHWEMDMWADQARGDAESCIGWYAQIGKRIMRGDSQGFVWLERFDNVHEADMIVSALERVESAWDRPEWDEDCEAEMHSNEHQDMIDDGMAYLAYAYACSFESCDSLEYDAWNVAQRPAGPIG